MHSSAPHSNSPFGRFSVLHPEASVLERQTLKEVADFEYAALEGAIKRVARPGSF